MKQIRRSEKTLSAPAETLIVERPDAENAVETSPPAGDPNDLVSDILRRFRDQLIPAEILERIEKEVRRDWGGERTYVAKCGELGRQIRTWRDQQIRADYNRGEHIPLLMRRWGLKERRIWKILSEN